MHYKGIDFEPVPFAISESSGYAENAKLEWE